MPVTAQAVLDVRDLHVSYTGAVKALRGVSLAVPGGAVMAVLGSNGAGKTTLLRALVYIAEASKDAPGGLSALGEPSSASDVEGYQF